MGKSTINSAYIREQKRYTKDDLCEILKKNAEDTSIIISRLRTSNILKMVNKTADEEGLNDLSEEQVVFSASDENPDDVYYVFTYVGIICIAGQIILCYPKYIKTEQKPLLELKQVLKVLDHQKVKQQNIDMANLVDEESSFNMLPLLLFLMSDYFDNGLYNNQQLVYEINGSGEISWDQTINNAYALVFDESNIVYPELKTKRIVDDVNDYFRKLHECIVTEASNALKEANILELYDYSELVLSEQKLDEFGDTDYILYRLQKELMVQFNSRKQLLLKVMYIYINRRKSILGTNSLSFIGTNSFNLVWERVCKSVMGDCLHREVGTVDGFEGDADQKLIDVIEKPHWKWNCGTQKSGDTLIPDIVNIGTCDGQKYMYIFDAKYYVPLFDAGKNPSGVPGIESISKQYLYQLAYRKFCETNNIQQVRNCFLIPSETDDNDMNMVVYLEMMKELKLEDIQVRMLPAKEVYSCYLKNEKYPLEKLAL